MSEQETNPRNTDDPAAKLAHMAGQIADFFAAYPEAEAATSVALHINKFWSRRMREDFLAAFTANQTSLHPVLIAAIPLIKGAKAA